MPLFSDTFLDEVRNAASIVSVVSEYVALRRRGRNHQARCPFHNEKTPSFNVNEEKQIFHCFGCGVGGDVFKFLGLIEHISFPEAVRLLASRHGIPLPAAAAAGDGHERVDAERLRTAMAEAAELYHRTLVEDAEGKTALDYLERRGVTRETIGRLELGFSPGSGNAAVERLLGKGYTLEDLDDCGLIKRSEGSGRPYDTFRSRVMFPITDVSGRIIAFGGRTLGDGQPKYLNSPETKLYNKSRNLYGLSFSREGIKRSDCAILVEGYMDFLIPFQAGVDNIVASLGTSLTSQQVRLLGRYTHEVVVSYDPDSAGVSAAERSLALFLEEDFRVKVLRLPEGKDPDDLIRESGVAEYRRRLEESMPYLEFVLESAVRRQGSVGSPRDKVQVLNAVLPYLAKLPNAVERSDYVFRFARKIGVDDKLLLAEVRKAATQRSMRVAPEVAEPRVALKAAEKKLLHLLLSHPTLQSEIIPMCGLPDFAGLAGERLFGAILDRFKTGETCSYESLQGQFAGETEQSLLAEAHILDLPESPTRETGESCLSALRTLRLTSYKDQLVAKIAEAHERKDQAMLSNLYKQQIQVDQELLSLSRK